MSRCLCFIWILLNLTLISCSSGGGDDFVPGNSDAPIPTVTSVTPAVGPDTGGTRVTVVGSNFLGAISVTLGGTDVLDLDVISSTTLSFTVPAGPIGFAEIIVDSATGTSLNTPPLGFTRLNEIWSSLPSSGVTPAGRSFGKMLYDPTRRRMLLFGGESFDSMTFATTYFGDVWALDLTSPTITSASWILLSPDPGTSGIGSFAEMAVVYDSSRDRFLLTEGYNNCPPFPDPCVLISFAVYALSFSSTAVTDSGTWSRLTDTSVEFPPDRITPGATYDPVNDRLILFGGFDPVGFIGSNGAGEFNDTWAFNLIGNTSGFWENLTPIVGTVPVGSADPDTASLTNPSLIFDPIQNRFVIFGGFTDTDPLFGVGELASDETYCLTLSPATSIWEFFPLGSVTRPQGSNGNSGVFDSQNQRMIIHGGFRGFGSDPLDETWVLDLSQPLGIWTFATTGPGVENHMMAYDEVFNRVILFGGSSVTEGNSDDTWLFTLD